MALLCVASPPDGACPRNGRCRLRYPLLSNILGIKESQVEPTFASRLAKIFSKLLPNVRAALNMGASPRFKLNGPRRVMLLSKMAALISCTSGVQHGRLNRICLGAPNNVFYISLSSQTKLSDIAAVHLF